MGDLIAYRYPRNDGSRSDTYAGRVIGKANFDGCGKPYEKKMLAVLEFSWYLDTAYLRHIDPDWVTDVRTPPKFMHRVLLESKLPDPEIIIALAQYGGLNDCYIEKYLDENGNIRKNWRDYTGHLPIPEKGERHEDV